MTCQAIQVICTMMCIRLPSSTLMGIGVLQLQAAQVVKDPTYQQTHAKQKENPILFISVWMKHSRGLPSAELTLRWVHAPWRLKEIFIYLPSERTSMCIVRSQVLPTYQ